MNKNEFEAALDTGKVVDSYADGGEYIAVAIVTRPAAFNEFGRKVRDASTGRVGFDDISAFIKPAA